MADNQLNKLLGTAYLNNIFQTIYIAPSSGDGRQVAGTLNICALDPGETRYLDVVINDGVNDFFYIEHMGLARGGTDVIPISVADGQSIKVRTTTAPVQMIISAATTGNPVIVTVDSTASLDASGIINQLGVIGMTEINTRFRYTVTSTTQYSLQGLSEIDVNGAGFTLYTSGGTADKQIVDATFWGYEENIPQV